jgi:hypothetical protein
MKCYWLVEFLNKFGRDRRYEDLVVALGNIFPRTCPVFIKVKVCIVDENMVEIEVYIDQEEFEKAHRESCRQICKPVHCYRECRRTEEGRRKCRRICVKRSETMCYLRCMKEEFENAVWWFRTTAEDIETALFTYGLIYEASYDRREKRIKFRVFTKRVPDRWMLH